MSSDAPVMKKPQSAYFLWLNANRASIQEKIGAKDFKSVMAKASELWKSMPAGDKKQFEDEATKLKQAYDQFKQTDEGKAALTAKKDARQEKNTAKENRAVKAAVKAVEKDDRLKKPTTAYWLWLNDNRGKVKADLEKSGEKAGVAEIARKAGSLWKELPDAEKLPYENKAKEQKDAYDAYIKSPEGQEAQKAYKDAAKAAKSEVIGKVAEEESTPQSKRKRNTDEKEAGTASKKAKENPPKSDILSAEMLAACKAAQVKDAASFEGSLRRILELDVLKAKGVTPEQGLDALKKSGGLFNKAKGALLAGSGGA
mmetsp:Transcript_49112/g.87315  ORF Transcript_49112/g.87315 Transcript_49112/m.87315 type:complete len:313 (-) Transcript_49112:103-1041(-)